MLAEDHLLLYPVHLLLFFFLLFKIILLSSYLSSRLYPHSRTEDEVGNQRIEWCGDRGR